MIKCIFLDFLFRIYYIYCYFLKFGLKKEIKFDVGYGEWEEFVLGRRKGDV